MDNEIFCPHFFTNITCHSEERSDEESKNNKQDSSLTAQNNKKKQIGCGGCKRQMISYEKQLELKE